MRSEATSPQQYIDELPEDRKEPILKLRQQILDNLPEGVEESMGYGMLGYAIPHSVYPDGYHCTPELPLPFMSLASQKNFIGVYSMVIYAKKEVYDWFTSEYAKRCKYKLDMGKSCIRLKRMDDIPYELIGELTAKVGTEEWIQIYEDAIKNRKK
ncbi:DUF1801 domain-containing protein [Seonamhaeicola maritimus]|uniref:DUF1801 domain-containing protein n=1 Tax=Seonamhaeicola maritimus TaxID=2591822 RepID=UPI0024951090|nr:DUF1801 domain-containing protein [Seonamhaeicola maritimus]